MKKFMLHFSFVLLVLIVPDIHSAIIDVPGQVSTIQGAIEIAQNGDTVLVADGNYFEFINYQGKKITVASLYLTTGDTLHINNTIINGNNSGTVVTFSNAEDSTSILIGFTVGFGVADYGGGIYCKNASPKIQKNKFTFCGANIDGGAIYCENANPVIRNNFIDTYANEHGGGIYCLNSNPQIISNEIIGDAKYGGGIYCENSSPDIVSNNIHNCKYRFGGGINCTDNSNANITQNTISNNTAEDGGGIFIQNSSPQIYDNIIQNNDIGGWQDAWGAGILCSQSNSEIIGNTIKGNVNADWGGGIMVIQANPKIINNEISENTATSGGGIYTTESTPFASENVIANNNGWDFGGGIYVLGGLTLYNSVITENTSITGGGLFIGTPSEPNVIVNNTFSGNVADNGAGLFTSSGQNIIVNSIFWNDTTSQGSISEIEEVGDVSSFSYCDVKGGWAGTGNIDFDPLFRNPLNMDFHLMSVDCGNASNSPCIDAGDQMLNDSLLNCSRGLGLLRSDIGAYGGGYIITGIETEEIIDVEYFSLEQNYPNPFNPSTKIKFTVPFVERFAESLKNRSERIGNLLYNVTLKIYDILGNEVATLVNEEKSAGSYEIIFDASSLTSGVYFYKINAGNFVSVKKMLLLK